MNRGPFLYKLCPSARVAHLKMASVVTTEVVRTIRSDKPPFSLIERPGLLSRLIQALQGTFAELVGNPRGFIRDLLSADTKDAKRRQRIYLGLGGAFVLHAALIVLIAVLGWHTMFVKPAVDQPPDYRVVFPWIPASVDTAKAATPEAPKGDASGGGGGGQLAAPPPSKGVLPATTPLPPIVNMNPSNIPEPALPFSPTIVGPQSAPPPPAPAGDPAAKSGAFSGGPGEGGGIGRGTGPGVGGGKDSGAGTGSRGGKGNGPAGSPDASGTEIPNSVDIKETAKFAGYRTWSWIRRQTAIITPEAQENKVIGTVVLRATFNSDGTITDIQVAMPVDFMNESAVEALRRSTFHPATIKGVPVTVRNVLIRISVHY